MGPSNEGRRARASLSREVVKGGGRPAWATGDAEHAREFYFDGKYFWHRADGTSRFLSEDEAPMMGWSHRPDCICPLCRDAA